MITPMGNKAGGRHESIDVGPSVKHYYGDVVRVLFIILAGCIALAVPLSGVFQLGLYIAGPMVIALVVLAGMTNPHSRTVFVWSVVISGFGVLVAETMALAAYAAHNLYFFLALEVVSAGFIAALYYSVKTLRAARMHKIGKIDGVGEFDQD